MAAYKNLTPPTSGSPIRMIDRKLSVPDQPIIPFVEGDGTGPDIWRAAVRVFDAAVEKAYAGRRKIVWFELYAGQKSYDRYATWLPDDTIAAFREYLVGIKGPLTTPIGGGIRSLNVALRQMLDLYVCLRPVRYFKGVPSPVKRPELVDMVIFRENTEDIYAGIEWAAGTTEVKRVIAFLQDAMGVQKIRFPQSSAIGVKPVSVEGSKRLIRAAIRYALANRRKSVTLVHKGNIMKFTEGGFRDWGYDLAREEFGAKPFEGGPWHLIPPDPTRDRDSSRDRKGAVAAAHGGSFDPTRDHPSHDRDPSRDREGAVAATQSGSFDPGRPDAHRDEGAVAAGSRGVMVKDAIADITLQQVLTRPDDFDVIATLNLNGDYLSDALAAQVGGIGIAPGGNINYDTGHAIFEATHGTAPKYAGQDKVNPGSVILSGEMMLRYLGWTEAADLIIKGMEGAIAAREVTYDFERLMTAEGQPAKLLKCSEFGTAVVRHMS